jgi:hypothetical protein
LRKHTLRVDADYGWMNKILFALEITYNLAHLTLKASILLFYRNIFTLTVTPFKYAWFAIFAYVIANTIASLAVVFAQCQPIQYSWNQPQGGDGWCSNLKANIVATGVIIAIADTTLLALPMPLLWNLHVPLRQKLLICGLFGLCSM